MKITWLTMVFAGVFVGGTGSVLAKPDQAVLDEGKVQYAACVACHGPDGEGVKAGPLVMAPSLPESQMVKGDSDALALIVLKGIKKENADYVQQMLALQDAFKDDQLAAVLTYVRHEFGGLDDTITVKDVARWRKQFGKIGPAIPRGDVDGILIGAQGAKRLVSDLTWKEYKGAWSTLPDFTKLTPSSSGEAKNSLIDMGVTKLKQDVGLVFTGTLNLPKDDTYEFSTASDDGSDLWIDGKQVVNNDGIHGVVVKSGKAKLSAGKHKMMVRFFERSGGEELMVNIKAKSIGGDVSLSKKNLKKGGGNVARAIPLTPDAAGEAVMYRNFISGSSPRGIGVGYPGALNLCWDADTMNLSMLWRGDFMDAGRHWSGRGQGNQAPAGVDLTQVAAGPPLMVITSPEQSWPNDAYKVSYKTGRDTAERTKDGTFIAPYPGYRFLGYRLDAKRYPTFKYRFEDLEVTDGFSPSGASENPVMLRTLTFSGTAPANTMFRVAREATVNGQAVTSGGVTIKVAGATVTERNKEALISIVGGSTITITYGWDHPPELGR